MQAQPDPRVHVQDLGSLTLEGKRFVVNLRPGVPRNACIERDRDGYLRCWASRVWLDEAAANFVVQNSTYLPENNSFAWKEGVQVGETYKG